MMRLVTTVGYIMWLQIFQEPVRIQEWPSCTIEAIYTCSYNKDWSPEEERPAYEKYINSYRGYRDIWVLSSRLSDEGLEETNMVWSSYWMKLLRNKERVLVEIRWYKKGKYKFTKDDNMKAHAICWVGTIIIDWKERVVVKNTRWDENGIMWYNLVDPSVIRKRALVLK